MIDRFFAWLQWDVLWRDSSFTPRLWLGNRVSDARYYAWRWFTREGRDG